MARRFRRSFRRSGPRRRATWGFQAVTNASTTVAAASTQAVIIPMNTLVGQDAGTIVRTRGTMGFAAISGNVATTRATYGIGLIPLVNGQVAPTTEFPSPGEAAAWDGWFVFGSVIQRSRIGTGSASSGGFNIPGIEIDSRAMRKYDESMAIIIAVQNESASGGDAPFDWDINLRFLIKDA